MFTYIKVRNFKSLDDVTLNLKETKDKTKKLVAVYGENGCGKSNLINVFYFIYKLFHSFDYERHEIKLDDFFFKIEPIDLESFLLENDFDTLYKSVRTIDCNESTSIEVGFEIDNKEGYYQISFKNKIEYEKLYFFTGKQNGTLFEISKDECKLSSLIFKNNKIKLEFNELVSKYWGKHSMLAILYDFKKSVNDDYIKDNLSSYLYSFQLMMEDTSISLNKNQILNKPMKKEFVFLNNLENGSCSLDEEYILQNTEEILNDFFTQAYADVNKVYYKTNKTKNKISYNLVFDKIINGRNRLIPSNLESSGTRQIIHILKNLFGAFCGCSVVIDEIDDGVHDLLFKAIIDSMKDKITGQLIFTTHNTTLLDSLDPKMVYIINNDYEGKKEISCLSEYKIQDHNCARTRYLKGLYGGVPLVDSIEYDSIINNLKGIK